MKFWQLSGGNDAAGKAELRIYGDIGSWWEGNTAQEFGLAVDAVTAKELDVYINSYGGLADQGLAMSYVLRRFAARGTLRTHNDGIVASAAVAPFLAGDQRFAPAGTLLMIHQASSGVWGEAEDLRKTADVLEKLSDSVAELYAQRTGKDVEAIKAMMAATTYMTPDEQIEHGFATDKPGSEVAIEATMQGAVLMCGGQAVDLQKLPGLPATMLAAMLGGSKPKQAQTPVQQAPAATNKEAEKVNQPAGSAGVQEGEGPKMDLEKLKAEHPELHAAVMAAGGDAERTRIAAIEGATPAGFEQDAKLAIEQKLSPEAFAMSVLKKQKEQGTTFLQHRAADAAAADGPNHTPNADGKTPEMKAKEEQDAVIKMAAGACAVAAGVKA
jgi:ATP-dependent Clp protease protease subunit